jgi:nickel transport protein
MKIVSIIILLSLSLFAHQINLFAIYENGKLYVEGFYLNGLPCNSCDLNILDSNNKDIKLKLDRNGKFEESIELTKPIEITLIADSNHLTKFKIENESTVLEDNLNINNNQDIKKFIRDELKVQLEMIKIEFQRANSNFDKIVSALGYIFGIFGLWVFFKRK